MSFLNPFSSPNAQTTRNANNDRIAGVRDNRARAYWKGMHKAEARGDTRAAKHCRQMAEMNEREARRFRGE